MQGPMKQLAFTVYCALAVNVPYGAVRAQSPDCPLFGELTPAAAEWRRAILAKDTAKLATLAIVDNREQVAADLRNPRSTLSRALFGHGDTVAEAISDERTAVAIFERGVTEAGGYATTCYYRGVPPKWPKTYLELVKLTDNKSVFCLDWVRDDDGKWYVPYGFAYPDDDSDQR